MDHKFCGSCEIYDCTVKAPRSDDARRPLRKPGQKYLEERMLSHKKIGAPFTLASLPRPLASTDGRTQAAVVQSLGGSKKRKRAEIAVGVDGEGISIFSLQNPQLVTSYALPPQASFHAPPCSLYWRNKSSRSFRRYTYASITHSGTGERPQLVCFHEGNQVDGDGDTVKTAFPMQDSADKVLVIEALPIPAGSSSEESLHDVLVLLESGRALCLSADLRLVRWETYLRLLSGKQQRGENMPIIEHAALSTARSVIHGVLRGRADIAAAINAAEDSNTALLDLIQILCVVFKDEHSSTGLALYQLHPRAKDLMHTQSTPLKHLHTFNLPPPVLVTNSSTSKRLYSLHTATGVLHQLSDNVLTSFNLSGTVPKIYSEFKIPSDIHSILRLAPDTIFGISQHNSGIYDVKYKSLQSFVPLTETSNQSDNARKRKHVELSSSQQLPFLISYSADSGLAVGVLNHELVGFQLGTSPPQKRSRTSGTLLVDSLGRGFDMGASRATQTAAYYGIPRESPQWHEWQKKVHRLDKYVSKGRIAEFEELLARELGVELGSSNETDDNTKVDVKTNGGNKYDTTNGVHEELPDASTNTSTTTNEVSDLPLRNWELPQVVMDTAQHSHRHQAIYALSKIFLWTQPRPDITTSEEQPPLKINFFPPNVFQWLLRAGYMTKESIRRSLIEHHTGRSDMTLSISDGDIVKAVAQFDPEYHILSAILNHSHFLPVGEVVQSIKTLMQSLDETSPDLQQRLLTNGTDVANEDVDIDISSEIEAATNDLDHALSVLNNGVSTRSHALRPALIRLHSFPSNIISSTFNAMLSRHNLESLIKVLLIELKNGGWTSPYDFDDFDSLAEPVAEGPDDHAVAIISSLLSCALDAIGTGTWLASVGQSTSNDSAEVIMNELHEETTLALNGFWEARFMKGLLSEFLRYAANLSKTRRPKDKTLQKQGKPFANDIVPDGTLPMLPLGGKIEMGIEKTKPGKGGKREERSSREIGLLISKRVPKYSFERIVL